MKIVVFIVVAIAVFLATHCNAKSSKSRLSFEEEALVQHNLYRKNHGVPKMKLDPKPTWACCYILGDIGVTFMKEEKNITIVAFPKIVIKNNRKHQSDPSCFVPDWITRVAQDWANHLAQIDPYMLQHRPDNKYGENIFKYPGSVKAKDAVDSWYHESKLYKDYKNDPSISGYPDFKDIGHFTQLVWKGSKRLGVAKATSRSGNTYVVANYSPPGNYGGKYVANVLPPRA